MTQAKLLALMERRRDWLVLIEAPTAQLASLIYNANRNPGNPDKGIAAFPVLAMSEFQMYRRTTKSLAAKDTRDYTLLGADASREDWLAYSKGKQIQLGGTDDGRVHKQYRGSGRQPEPDNHGLHTEDSGG